MYKAILLGALQGITEFLPVSSSGHLVIAQHLLGVGDIPLLFDVLLHVATLIVVLGVFWNKIAPILISLFRLLTGSRTEEDRANGKLALILLIGTAITAGLGLVIKDLPIFANPHFTSAMFLVTAVLLMSTAFAKKQGRNLRQIKISDGIIIGLIQGLAVIPGISRSGSTISAGLLKGIDRESAGDFSFLLFVPAVLGALILELKDLGQLATDIPFNYMLSGMLSAFIAGYYALLFLLRLIRGGKLYLFSIYLIPVGILGLIYL
ncbi:undecaprenyl-diphosphate phosphatase [Spirochaetia bacterium 38H-sp]|uniref:Undecaprenyl-diphosphatase n=1 Tax=Rarispira pelagica TaxID=3141764 RepID=A0ABU9UCJ1_9SPIR